MVGLWNFPQQWLLLSPGLYYWRNFCGFMPCLHSFSSVPCGCQWKRNCKWTPLESAVLRDLWYFLPSSHWNLRNFCWNCIHLWGTQHLFFTHSTTSETILTSFPLGGAGLSLHFRLLGCFVMLAFSGYWSEEKWREVIILWFIQLFIIVWVGVMCFQNFYF